jgi:hypothetical protein
MICYLKQDPDSIGQRMTKSPLTPDSSAIESKTVSFLSKTAFMPGSNPHPL